MRDAFLEGVLRGAGEWVRVGVEGQAARSAGLHSRLAVTCAFYREVLVELRQGVHRGGGGFGKCPVAEVGPEVDVAGCHWGRQS